MNLISFPYSFGSGLVHVCKIKRFKHKDLAYKFLATGSNSLSWKLRDDLDLPTGNYKTQIDSKTIRYINTKTDKVYTFTR
jgi:hypothetical protein